MGLEILITNDDGYTSKGINVLKNILAKYGNVTVVAPNEGQSGMSSALTIGKPLRLREISREKVENGNQIDTYALTGTPVDCVKMAMNRFYMHRKPDLLVSGINHGSNTSAGSVYSGTLGGCIEGTIYGVPSIGLSLDSHNPDADFSVVEKYFGTILQNYLEHPAAPGIYLNINFPAIPADAVKGIKFAAQGKGMWIKEFNQRKDPYGNDYFWMTGEFLDKEEDPGKGDHKLVEQGYITIVPHRVDTTDYAELEALSAAWNIR